MMGVRAALALALAATMPVAAACSNDVDERNAYVAAVNRAQTDFRTNTSARRSRPRAARSRTAGRCAASRTPSTAP